MSCKVDRVRDRYDLRDLDERLERRYNLGDEVGVRDLEEYLNTWILRRAINEAGMVTLDGEVDNYHRLLTDDNVSECAFEGAYRELKQGGLDVDAVVDDFVSYQTVRKHLNECLGIDTSRPDYEPSFDDARQRIGKLATRLETVTSRVISRLRDHDALAMGEPEVTVHVKVECGNCGRILEGRSLLRRQGCSCERLEI